MAPDVMGLAHEKPVHSVKARFMTGVTDSQTALSLLLHVFTATTMTW